MIANSASVASDQITAQASRKGAAIRLNLSGGRMEFLAWPVIVLLIAVIFILLFRPHIGRFIDRTRSFKMPGIHAQGEDAGRADLQTAAPAPSLIGLEERLGTPPLDDVLSPIERELAERLKASVQDAPNQLHWALRLLALNQVQLGHEIVLRTIFGSQVQALRRVTQAGGTVALTELQPMFAATREANPQAYTEFSFEHWLYFLTSRGLVRVEAQNVSVTPLGRNFLVYLAHNGLNDPGGL